MPFSFNWPPTNDPNSDPIVWHGWFQSIFRKMKSWFSSYYNVKDYGALGDASQDDTGAINAAIADINAAGKGTLWFPQGRYKITASTTAFTVPATVRGAGPNSIIQTDVASTACLTFNATSDMFGAEVCDLGFDSPTGAASTIGIKFTASSGKYIALSKFHDLHFTGVEAGINCAMTTTVASGGYNVIPFSNNNFVNLTCTQNTGGKYPKYGIKWDSGNGPHNVITACNFQLSNVAGSAAIIAGDATSGIGDLIISNCHFNLCIDGVKLTGPTTLTEYRNNILVTNCQFDGGITNGCNFTRCTQFQLVDNIMGGGVHNTFTGDNGPAAVEDNNIESRYSFTKSTNAVVATTLDIGKLTQTATSTYTSVFAEVAISGIVAGVAQAITTCWLHINWAAGVPTVTKVVNQETAAGNIVINTAVVANEVKVQLTVTPAAVGSSFWGNIRVVGPQYKWTYL